MLVPAFLAAASTAADLCRHEAVRERWDEESACAGMTVGGLAFHLAGQAGNTVALVPRGPGDEPPIAVLEHYRRAAWANQDLDADANVGIRESADEQAAAGYDDLLAKLESDLVALPGVLAAAGPAVLIPWQGWSLSLHDWLVTRLMEMLVHADDLAVSLDLEPPEFPSEAAEAVVGLLSAVAIDRHGATSVVRALSRPQRAPSTISAF